MKIRRIEQEEAYTQKAQNVIAEGLCGKFGASKNIIRRGLIELGEKGGTVKNYGGVSNTIQSYDVEILPFSTWGYLMLEEKKRIAEGAAEFIDDGGYIFVDSGSTVYNLVGHIKNLNVIVPISNLNSIVRALQYLNTQIITFSGILNRDYYSFTNIDERGAEILSSYSFTKTFMTTIGVIAQYGVMNSLLSDDELEVIVANHAQEVYLLADHIKSGKVAIRPYGSLEQIDTIITNQPPSDEMMESTRQCSCEIIVI